MPSKIKNNASTDSVEYRYSSSGVLLEKRSTSPSGSISYFNELVLQEKDYRLNHAYGETKLSPSNARVTNYWLKDHLGSVRVVINDSMYLPTSQDKGLSYYPFGLTHSQRTCFNATYKYNAKEQDTALYLMTYNFGFRWYNPITANFLSIDPLAQDYRDWSGYNFVLGNPINRIDPDGRAPVWVPDANGNLVAEKRDDAKTLAKFLNITQEEALSKLISQGYGFENSGEISISVGDVVELDNEYTRSIKNSTSDFTTYKALRKLKSTTGPTSEDYYNCWGSALEGTHGRPIEAGIGINNEQVFDKSLMDDYLPTTKNDMIFGKTVIRFANRYNQSKHGAVFYGRSRKGAVYIYTKNGYHVKPEIMSLANFNRYLRIYGKTQGINEGEDGYYTIKPEFFVKPKN